MIIRKAEKTDIPDIAGIYDDVHTFEEEGRVTIGWIRGVYPTESTAMAAYQRDDLFVMEDNGKVIGAAVINQTQVDVYEGANWRYSAPDEEVMVLHTLVISPYESSKGYGKAFIAYYEDYALKNGCRYLRIDTNARNANARRLYAHLGYEEIDILPCEFNGIPDIDIVLLEKRL